MEQVVIGASRFKTLTQTELNRFLDHTQSLGINKIDSAPLYECEEKIGNYLETNSKFLVSTKTTYHEKSKQPLKILEEFNRSQQNLKTQNIECLFFHSTPPALISEVNLEELSLLKGNKLIKKIGYSGADFDLSDLKFRSQLDCLMITFNALDITDYNLIHKSNLEIYVKRPMANFIFKGASIREFKSCIKNFLRMKRPIDTQSYQFRFEKIQGRNSFNDNLKFYTRFLTHFNPRAKYVFGVSKIEHLDQIVKTINILNNELTEDLIAYFNRLQLLSEEFKWRSLT